MDIYETEGKEEHLNNSYLFCTIVHIYAQFLMVQW